MVFRGLFGKHSRLSKVVYVYLPWGIVGDFVEAHERVHVVTGVRQDHEAPPYCLMNGSRDSDGWEEKGPLVWLNILGAAMRRGDWLCQECRALLEEASQ